MVDHLGRRAYAGVIVAGLPSFATLSNIAEHIAPTVIASTCPPPSDTASNASGLTCADWVALDVAEWGSTDVAMQVEADLLSPGGTALLAMRVATRRVCGTRRKTLIEYTINTRARAHARTHAHTQRRVPGGKARVQGHVLVVSRTQ